MLHVVYIIHQHSGTCLLELPFPGGNVEFDSNLISGYLTAFKDFGAEVSKGKGELKVINMDVFNLIMVMKNDIYVAGATDKKDDSMVVYHDLSLLLDKFLKKFRSTLEGWRGEITIFKDFKKEAQDILKDGKHGEIILRVPILKIYKKQFLAVNATISKKNMVWKREEYRNATKIKDVPWIMNKKLPSQVVAQGYLSDNTYKIAHLADGIHSLEEIADQSGISGEDATRMIQTLDDLGLIDYIEVN